MSKDRSLPGQLVDQFLRLKPEDRAAFLRMASLFATADDVYNFASNLNFDEARTLSMRLNAGTFRRLWPVFIAEAIRLVKASADVDEAELLAGLHDGVRDFSEAIRRESEERTSRQARAAHGKPHDHAIIQRNVRILDDHRRKLTPGQIARKHKNASGKPLSRTYVRKVITEEAHWRRLAAELQGGTEYSVPPS